MLTRSNAVDLVQSGVVEGCDGSIIGSNDYSLISNSDVVIVTAGIARKPGMSRDYLLNTNTAIIKTVGENIAKYCKLNENSYQVKKFYIDQ